MKIEIDTKHDTKEELMHLANMLHAFSGSEGSNVYQSRLQKRVQRAKNIFEDDSPTVGNSNITTQPRSGGLFGMFGNTEPTAQPTIQQPKILEPTSQTVDTFSIFGNNDTNEAKEPDTKDDDDSPSPVLVPY